jgi:hypothetical protein
MTTYYQDESGQGQTLPAPAVVPLTGLQPMTKAPALEVYRAQDRVVGLSRRVILSWGLRGDVEWMVPNTDPEVVGQTHPDSITYYPIARGMIELTPGCGLRLTGAAIPSGETQVATAAGPPNYTGGGAFGAIRVTCVWTDASAATETTTNEISLPGSTLEFGSELTSAGGLFQTLFDFDMDIFPPSVPFDLAEVERFSNITTATITVEVRGSPRCVDANIHEVPLAIAVADDGSCASHMFGAGSPEGDAPQHDYPYDADATSRGRGTAQALVTARQQVQRLGPCLVQWTAYTEEAADYDTRIIPITSDNDGATFLNLLFPALTSYDADAEAGWSVSCGGYARRWAANSPFVLRDRIAAVPVLVRVYGRTITAGTGTFRFQTAAHSYVDVNVPTAGADAWVEAFGYLECGVNPDQKVIGQAFMNHVGASGSLSISAFEVYVSDPGAPAVV